MTRFVFIDVETTSLRPDRRAWEIGLIVREPDGTQRDHSWLIGASDLDLGNADPKSLDIGRFWQRHPDPHANFLTDPAEGCLYEADALSEVSKLTQGAVLVGANIAFDAETLATRMRERDLCPAWNYHLVDVEPLAAGRLGVKPPWNLSFFIGAFGIESPPEDRHTALGDARLAMHLYDAVYHNHPMTTATSAAPPVKGRPDDHYI